MSSFQKVATPRSKTSSTRSSSEPASASRSAGVTCSTSSTVDRRTFVSARVTNVRNRARKPGAKRLAVAPGTR